MTTPTNHENDDLEEWERLLLKKLKAIYRKLPPIKCCKNNNCNCEALLFDVNHDVIHTKYDIIETSTKDQK